MNALDPGWFPDPMGRHEYRWWTGSAWGEHVSDRGLTVIDPVASAPPAAASHATSQPAYQPAVAYSPAAAYPQVTATGAPPSSAAAGIGWATFVGAAIAGASALLSWVDTSFSSVNGFDVPAAFLVDYETGFDSGFSVGLVALVLAAAAMLAAVVRQPAMRQLGRVAGSGLVAVGVLFVVQLYRLADASDVSMSDLLGVAPFAAIVGGLTVLVAKGR